MEVRGWSFSVLGGGVGQGSGALFTRVTLYCVVQVVRWGSFYMMFDRSNFRDFPRTEDKILLFRVGLGPPKKI